MEAKVNYVKLLRLTQCLAQGKCVINSYSLTKQMPSPPSPVHTEHLKTNNRRLVFGAGLCTQDHEYVAEAWRWAWEWGH